VTFKSRNLGTLDKRTGIVFDHALPFDILGRRPHRPRALPAPRIATDINIEIDTPRVADLASIVKGYSRLR
jgi:hypothetical protein